MYSALQSLQARGAAGDPLPTVWEALKNIGVHFLRGQLHMVAAAPGVGKSAFILNYVVKAPVSSLYFSADSDAFTQLTRIISIQTGIEQDEAASLVRSGDLGKHEEALKGLPVRFIYEAYPKLEDIKNALESYEELYGAYPELVIIDNLSNVWSEQSETTGDRNAARDAICEELDGLAGKYQTAVIALHHVTGANNDSVRPVSLAGLLGQVSKSPAQVLTLHKINNPNLDYDSLRVSPVKNRGSKGDPSGETWAELEFEGGKMDIRDPRNHWGVV